MWRLEANLQLLVDLWIGSCYAGNGVPTNMHSEI